MYVDANKNSKDLKLFSKNLGLYISSNSMLSKHQAISI